MFIGAFGILFTPDPAWCIDGGKAKEVFDSLEIARDKCWRAYLVALPGLRLEQLLGLKSRWLV